MIKQQRAGRDATQVDIHGDGNNLTFPGSGGANGWARAGVIVAVIGVLFAGLSYFDVPIWPVGGTPRPPSDTPSVGMPGVPAKVVNTRPEGYLFAYPGPDGSVESRKPIGTWKEGQTVTVVCQERYGRPISAPPYPGHPTTSTVWDRIAWPQEMWVPDIYTDLTKTGDKPPAGLPTCDRLSA